MSYLLKIIFAGTPYFAAYHLNALINANYNIVGIFTQPDSISGRGKKLTISPVKKIAIQYKIPIFQPKSLYEDIWYDTILMLKADIMIVVCYGLILPSKILHIPYLGCINVHASLLPRWRGAAPIQWALLSGDTKTGITIIQMDSGLDTGEILYQVACTILSSDTSVSMYNKLAPMGVHALLNVLNQILTNNVSIIPKNNTVKTTYANKLTKQDGLINWNLSANYIERCIRAFNPWPSSFFLLHGQIIKVWSSFISKNQSPTLSTPGLILSVDQFGIQVITGDGILVLTSFQFPGKKIISTASLLHAKYNQLIPGIYIT